MQAPGARLGEGGLSPAKDDRVGTPTRSTTCFGASAEDQSPASRSAPEEQAAGAAASALDEEVKAALAVQMKNAVLSGNEDAVRVAVAAGADVNHRYAAAGLTALHLAAVHGCAGAACALIEAGADPLLRTLDEHELTALDIAAGDGSSPVLKLLREVGSVRSSASGGFKEGDLACPGESPQVLVHVYDLWGASRRWPRILNTGTTRFGLFHTGIEVYGREWYFCGTQEGVFHGVYCMPKPKEHPVHRYSFTVAMGATQLSREDLEELIPQIREKWPGSSYNAFKRNCHSFVDFFCKVLGFESGPKFGICGSGDRKLAHKLLSELRAKGDDDGSAASCARCLSLRRRREARGPSFLQNGDEALEDRA